jgi:MFS family permease
VVGASLADIQGAIGAGADDGGWITTSYLVAEIVIIPLSGWLARAFSMRTYLLTNTILFLALTAACALAQNLAQMIVVRALQGLAGGVLIPLAFTIIMTKLPRGKHITRLAVIAVASIAAFIYVELKRHNPLLQLRLLARRNFGLGTLANFVFGFAMFGWIYLVPLYLSRMQGYSSQEIGGVMIWLGLPQLLFIPFIPRSCAASTHAGS